jgi:hypothetical protein
MLCEDGSLLIFQDGVLSTARKDIDSKSDINNIVKSKVTLTDIGIDDEVVNGSKEQGKEQMEQGKGEEQEEGNEKGKEKRKEDDYSTGVDVEGTFRSTYTDDETFVRNPSSDSSTSQNTTPQDSTHTAPSPTKLRDLSLTVETSHDNTLLSTLENGGQNPLSDPISPLWPGQFRVEISPAMTPISFALGTWSVRIESQEIVVDTEEEKSGKKNRGLEHVRTLQSVRMLLDGNFHYHLLVPSYCSNLSVLAPNTESGSSSHGSTKTDSEVSLSV